MKLFALSVLLGAAPASGAMVVESLPRLGALPPAAGPVPTTVPPLPSAAPALLAALLAAPSPAAAPLAAPIAARPAAPAARGFEGPAALVSARAVAASAGDGASFDGSLSAAAEPVPLRSSISTMYGGGPVSRDALIDTSIAPHHVQPKNVKILDPDGRSAAAALRGRWHDFWLGKLAVLAAPLGHLTRFGGVVPAGSAREIQWAISPLSLTRGHRKISPYTGLQLSLSLDGGPASLAKTSLVFYARGPRAGTDGVLERLKFVGALPAAPVAAVLREGEAPSYAVDFENMLLEDDPARRTLADLLVDVEIDGVGLAFKAPAGNWTLRGAVFGEMYFLSDLAKASAQFARRLERLSTEDLVEELVKELPFLSPRQLREIALAMDLPGAGDLADQALLTGHYQVENLIAAEKRRLKALDREQLFFFFQERPVLVNQRPHASGAPGTSKFLLDYWAPPHRLMSTVASRLYDPVRQENTLRVLREQGYRPILRALEAAGFKPVKLKPVNHGILWERTAGYGRDARVLHHIPTDVGAFGRDHGRASHLLQAYTIIEGMSRRELEDFRTIFRQMQTSATAFIDLWTLIFEAPGSATPNSPRYWRDRVRASSRGA